MSALRRAGHVSLWQLVQVLMYIRDSGPPNPAVGICTNTITASQKLGYGDYWVGWHNEIEECCKSWPLYSGNYECPIPDVVNALGLPIKVAAGRMYWDGRVAKWPHRMTHKAYHYLPETPYAEDRVRLLHWCIEKVQEELARRLEVFVC